MAHEREAQPGDPFVVLAEDSDDQALVILRALEQHGFRTRREASARGLLSSLAAGTNEIVLLDLGLPDMHGLEALQQIVQRSGEIPVIALTALDDIKIAVGAIRMGAWDYVVKRPDLSHLDELPDVIRRNQDRRRVLHERNRAVARLNQDVRDHVHAMAECVDRLERAQPVGTAAHDLLGTIRDRASSIQAVTADFVVTQAIEAGALILNRQQVSLGSLVQRVVAEQQTWLSTKNITLHVHIAEDVPDISLDAGLMEHAVTNLLRHATSSTPTAGQVSVSVSRDAEALVLAVSDTGAGISQPEHSSLFRRSWWLRAASGTNGLLLPIARAIVEAHGGRIAVDATAGKGSTVTISLPLASPA